MAIARAMLHNPRILILDEATSSVDVETEKQIQEAIGRMVEGRTTFAVSHRLSTLRHADRLMVLDGGRVIEVGTHEELMERKGAFYELVNMQVGADWPLVYRATNSLMPSTSFLKEPTAAMLPDGLSSQ